MQTEKSQPNAKQIKPETRFTEFPALSINLRVGISRSASETDDRLFFLHITGKIMANTEGHSEFCFMARK